jgi:hypothetical protein
MLTHTIVVRTGSSGRAILDGPGSLPVRVSNNGGGVIVDRPGTGVMDYKKGEEYCRKCRATLEEKDAMVEAN